MVLKEDHITGHYITLQDVTGQLPSISDKISILQWTMKEIFMGRGILLLQEICCIGYTVYYNISVVPKVCASAPLGAATSSQKHREILRNFHFYFHFQFNVIGRDI
jgi:hypothetical protein